jgi:ferric-dicitrate binding protein FerR (iron transport regulator)
MMRALAALLLLTACTAPEPPPAPPPQPQPAPPKSEAPAPLPERRFVIVEGEVTIDGQPAAKDMAIPETAKVVTGKGARAVMTLQPGGVIEMRESAELEVGTSKRHKTSMHLLSGILWSILPVGKADYEVVAPNAVAGVRGTTLFVDASSPGHTVLCTCQGEVELDQGHGKPKHYTGGELHHAVKISGKGKKTKISEVGKAPDAPNHPNAVREQLRALVTPQTPTP